MAESEFALTLFSLPYMGTSQLFFHFLSFLSSYFVFMSTHLFCLALVFRSFYHEPNFLYLVLHFVRCTFREEFLSFLSCTVLRTCRMFYIFYLLSACKEGFSLERNEKARASTFDSGLLFPFTLSIWKLVFFFITFHFMDSFYYIFHFSSLSNFSVLRSLSIYHFSIVTFDFFSSVS